MMDPLEPAVHICTSVKSTLDSLGDPHQNLNVIFMTRFVFSFIFQGTISEIQISHLKIYHLHLHTYLF